MSAPFSWEKNKPYYRPNSLRRDPPLRQWNCVYLCTWKHGNGTGWGINSKRCGGQDTFLGCCLKLLCVHKSSKATSNETVTETNIIHLPGSSAYSPGRWVLQTLWSPLTGVEPSSRDRMQLREMMSQKKWGCQWSFSPSETDMVTANSSYIQPRKLRVASSPEDEWMQVLFSLSLKSKGRS